MVKVSSASRTSDTSVAHDPTSSSLLSHLHAQRQLHNVDDDDDNDDDDDDDDDDGTEEKKEEEGGGHVAVVDLPTV